MVAFPCVVGEPPAIPDSPRDDDTPPAGTDFSVYKRIRQAAESIEERVRQALIPPGSAIATLRFLVVDDEPDAAEALAAVIELLGCSVLTCYDGESALTAAAKFEPHVCLLDLKMPEMNGLELANRLKEMFTDKPQLLIAVTAFGDPHTKALAVLSGFHHLMVKPVDVPSLIEAVTELWKVADKEGRKTDPPQA